MRVSLLLLSLLAPFGLSAPAAALVGVEADEALQQLLAQSARASVVGFERTSRAELRADPEKEPGLVIDRFEPRDAASGTWTLVSVDGRKPSAKELDAHRKTNANGIVPGFHRLHKVLGGKPTRRTEVGGQTVFLWDSLPAGAVVTQGGDISANLSAEATVAEVGGKPIFSQIRIFAAKPFKIRGIATMNSFAVTSVYRPGATGKPFLASQTSASDVDAPFGLGGKRRTVFSFRPL